MEADPLISPATDLAHGRVLLVTPGVGLDLPISTDQSRHLTTVSVIFVTSAILVLLVLTTINTIFLENLMLRKWVQMLSDNTVLKDFKLTELQTKITRKMVIHQQLPKKLKFV